MLYFLFVFGHIITYYFLYRRTPFANGPAESPKEILRRIGESNLDLESGNWTSVSSEAKVI